jgi:hypothetical protein
MFCASRSSRRWAQMRRTCDENVSAVDRYNSISWSPAASASSVGASPVVIRERRAEISAGEMEEGRGFDEVEDSCSVEDSGGLRNL